ncbi:MAG: hypothetical protein ACFE9L_10940 [Candidatus Hodarchaeota archaeon]
MGIEKYELQTEWASFEGTIVQGYGEGTVKIWDEGCVEWITRIIHRYFVLQGKKRREYYTLAPFNKNFLFYKVCEVNIEYSTSKEPEVRKYEKLLLITELIKKAKIINSLHLFFIFEGINCKVLAIYSRRNYHVIIVMNFCEYRS